MIKYNHRMSKGYLKNSIISLILTISFIVMPLGFIPKKTEAQNINAHLGGLSQVIPQLPLCQDKMVNGLKNLFNGTNGLDYTSTFPEPSSNPSDEGFIGPPMADGSLVEKNSDFLNDFEAIPVSLAPGVEKNIEVTRKVSEETQKSVQSLDENDTCLKSIGRAVAKMLLQKITLSTVEWINGGYDGSPKFIQNAGEFFGDMAKNEILQFGIEINNPDLFPFGKAFMQNQAIAFKTKFAQNAQYSLNEMIQNTNPQFNAATFQADFSQGGWDAWTYMTQVPANNPLGFNLMASNELQKRLEGTNQSNAQEVRASLQQAGGFLGDYRCADPKGVTKEEHENALRERAEDSSNVTEDKDGRYWATNDSGQIFEVVYENRICKRWEYVTPGGMVADAATKLVNYPDNNLLRVDDLNDAVAAIMDAMLNSFIPEINSEGGFAGLSDSDFFQSALEGNFIIGEGTETDFGNTWTGLDYTGFQISSSSFLKANPNFNIRTDLNQALIDEQRIFVEKLKEQNKELNSKDSTVTPTIDNGFFTGNYGLIPTIYQLDYCIPGPHPGFEADSNNALRAATGVIKTETEETINDQELSDITGAVETVLPLAGAAAGAIIGATIGSGVPIAGTIAGAAIGAAAGYLINMWQNNWSGGSKKKLRTYYAMNIQALTGINVNTEEKANPLHIYDKGRLVDIFNIMLDRYIRITYKIYDLTKMPSVTKEANIKYEQQKGYLQMFKHNEERIVSMKGIIKRLEGIKEEIDRLNCELNDDPQKTGCTAYINQEQYNDYLKPWISAFGRISAEMVNGDDIAAVDNTIKQIIDEKDYIYNDLLKGPNGCEKELETRKGLNGPGLPKQIYNLKRMEYPGPILYDYNKWNDANKNTLNLPDPYNSGYTDNKMALDIDINDFGPGFLPVRFSSGNYWTSDLQADCTAVDNPDCMMLAMNDLIQIEDDSNTKVNMINPDGKYGPIGDWYNGFFEFTIGIY